MANQPRKGKNTVTWDDTLELSITPLLTSYGSSQSLPGTVGGPTCFNRLIGIHSLPGTLGAQHFSIGS